MNAHKIVEIIMWRTLAFLIIYPLLHLPLFLLNIWPLIVGIAFGWGIAAFGWWMLWCFPFTFIMLRLDRWPWWSNLREHVLSWSRD